MFQPQGRQSSWAPFILQQVISLFSGLVLLIALIAASVFIPGASPVLEVASRSDAVGLSVLIGLSFSLGYLVQKRWPSSCRTGCWVWVIPVSLWVVSFATDLMSKPLQQVAASYFDSSYGEDEHLPLVFGTVPTLSACAYAAGVSLGLWWSRKHTKRDS